MLKKVMADYTLTSGMSTAYVCSMCRRIPQKSGVKCQVSKNSGIIWQNVTLNKKLTKINK